MENKRQIFLYLVFGVLTTLVDWITYAILWRIGVDYRVSTGLAWFFAVVFAFFTNRTYVFNSSKDVNGMLKEASTFFVSRISSGVINLLGMILLVDGLQINEFISKAIMSIAVLILNYVLSKFFVFKEQKNPSA